MTASSRWRTALAAVAVLAVSGCGSVLVDGTTTPTEVVTTADETVQPPTSAEPSVTVTTPPAPPQKLYRMNNSYSFEPISPNAPANAVLLTFDDGPSEVGLLTSMLNVLDAHNAKAIFFVNGYRAQPHPELLTLIAGRGHAIGNHSWDHVNLKKLSRDEVTQQIVAVQNLVAQTIGTAPRFFRPPFGAGNDVVEQIVADNGMLYMTWSDGSLDWDASTQGRPDLVVANVLEQLHPGANILMHELPRTAEALDPLLTQLKQRGYGFIDPATIE